ncbi:MAG TPA: YsnF/AvaK domain-containing protein [Longimicrobium sp.]|nr:YsnF/AvaK domain-containing protein [Longimicrobium sp.]
MRDNNDNLDRLDNRLDETTRRDAAGAEERLTLSEEQLAVGKRETSAGQVEVEKHVDTRHVREEVPVMRDEVTVERHELTGADAVNTDRAFTEEHISVPLTREEVVAEKRAVGAEEIVVRRNQVEDTQTVEADLRKERAEVHQTGDVRRVDEGGGMRADNPLSGGRDLDGDGVR